MEHGYRDSHIIDIVHRFMVMNYVQHTAAKMKIITVRAE